MSEQPYTSHKFGNDPLTEALWMITLNGFEDERAGTVDDIGWHGLIHVADSFISDEVLPDDSDIPMEITVPRGTYIVYSDSSGFVGHVAYDYRSAEASEEWRKIVAAESDAYGEDEPCDVCGRSKVQDFGGYWVCPDDSDEHDERKLELLYGPIE